MGEHGGWAQTPSGLLPNGLLPNEEAAWVSRLLDPERLRKAEERTAELIACIEPNRLSEKRRNDVVDYLRRLIKKCFSCEIEVFPYGSVPLKTYLPDGDIDLTVFSKDQNLKKTWASKVLNMLENEKKNENAKFRVTDVQYIPAAVKIIKCVVENIVVDISFNQLDGLSTLWFLYVVDHFINQNHLFKRSIILVKAWCYYESRILGARYGLISTFALETLVLYIFIVFNNSFAGPLEVLYRFLEFYSKFDWDNFCVSLWGPVPIRSLPDVRAEPPLKGGGELLFSNLFLDACCSVYYASLGGQENQGQPFVSKCFNVIDPSCMNSNLGRSVSKGNFCRIRRAFALGAERLATLLHCPKEDLFSEVNKFFKNTWDWHGGGNRPDDPRNDLWGLRSSKPDNQHGSENVRNNSSGKRNDVSSGLGSQAGVMIGSLIVPLEYGKGKGLSEHSSQRDDDSRNWNLPSTMGTGMAERNTGAQPVSLHVLRHQLADKPTSRSDRLAAAESRTDRPWGSHRNYSFPSYQSQNGPVRLNSTHSGSANVAYGRHPVATLNPSGVSSNGPNIPFFVMLYPYDHTPGYGSPAEQLEFGSPGQVSFSGMNETSQLSEGGQSGGVFVEQRFHGGSGQCSSPHATLKGNFDFYCRII
ncbi:hypothetical protein SLEP1_g9891 [Rubroshorea leprosula]|uniref:Polymerase nucleotidyl transferase domain-containing protein n=1 Tax=Rubroshorea leprosula TaxID=152421 RepID=A0AAV5IEA6_9ROSI|nr:hypothetical protein SLEP1_g9891 [Rubroshorea leprosula]